MTSRPMSIVLEEVTDHEELAQAKRRHAQFERNLAWFQTHAAQKATRMAALPGKPRSVLPETRAFHDFTILYNILARTLRDYEVFSHLHESFDAHHQIGQRHLDMHGCSSARGARMVV